MTQNPLAVEIKADRDWRATKAIMVSVYTYPFLGLRDASQCDSGVLGAHNRIEISV